MSDFVASVVKAAKAFIVNEKNWIRGRRKGYSQDGQYNAFCALGALDEATRHLAYSVDYSTYYNLALDALAKHAHLQPVDKDPFNVMYNDPKNKDWDLKKHNIDGLKVANFNNTHSHKEVLEMFDQAIAELEESKFEAA